VGFHLIVISSFQDIYQDAVSYNRPTHPRLFYFFIRLRYLLGRCRLQQQINPFALESYLKFFLVIRFFQQYHITENSVLQIIGHT